MSNERKRDIIAMTLTQVVEDYFGGKFAANRVYHLHLIDERTLRCHVSDIFKICVIGFKDPEFVNDELTIPVTAVFKGPLGDKRSENLTIQVEYDSSSGWFTFTVINK